MEPVVSGQDDVGVLELTGSFKLLEDGLDHVVDGFESSETMTLELVVVVNDGLVKLLQ